MASRIASDTARASEAVRPYASICRPAESVSGMQDNVFSGEP